MTPASETAARRIGSWFLRNGIHALAASAALSAIASGAPSAIASGATDLDS